MDHLTEMDKLDPSRRSRNMGRIRSKNTKPEVSVRKVLTRLGYRYRLHVKDLPGKPDLVFSKRKAVIFVHGCFWHQHGQCREGRMPASRRDYWVPKLSTNVSRDQEHEAALVALGWKVMTVWDCELADEALEARLSTFLGSPSSAI